MSTIDLKVEFSGGLELLFGNQRTHALSLPSSTTRSTDVTDLIRHLRTHVLRERPELFMEGDTVRPGILVLINDTDWELEGEGTYVLKDGDEIVFISTLHEIVAMGSRRILFHNAFVDHETFWEDQIQELSARRTQI